MDTTSVEPSTVTTDPELEKLEFIPFDDPRIHTPLEEFDFTQHGSRAQAIVDALFDKMFASEGLGLSANQVGLPYRVFVMGTQETKLALFNPRIVQISPELSLFREGCLTFPGLFLTLKRPKECVISYQDVNGNRVVQQFPGLAARIAQHEYDHVNGIDFTQRASPFKIRWELQKLKKQARKRVRSLKLQQRSSRRATPRR